MRVSYNKLWKLLIDKGMKKMDLLEAIEMSPNILAKMSQWMCLKGFALICNVMSGTLWK